MSEKISLTQALAEVKLLDKRIQDKIASSEFSYTLVGGKLTDRISIEQKTAEIKANFQSIKDLIERRERIKSAITLANSSIDVEIAGKVMKIAEAIDLKSSIENKKAFSRKLLNSISNSSAKAEIQNTNCQNKLSEMQKEKQSLDFIKQYEESFSGSVLDPLNIMKIKEEFDKEIFDFENQVDFKLSEINSVTKIEI